MQSKLKLLLVLSYVSSIVTTVGVIIATTGLAGMHEYASYAIAITIVDVVIAGMYGAYIGWYAVRVLRVDCLWFLAQIQEGSLTMSYRFSQATAAICAVFLAGCAVVAYDSLTAWECGSLIGIALVFVGSMLGNQRSLKTIAAYR